MIVVFELLLFIILLLISAFFSGAEAAFFSLKKSRLRKTKETEQIIDLLSQPRRLLVTILTGNTITNTAMAFFAALVTTDIARKAGASIPLLVAIETIVLSLVIVLVSEITPKILAIRNSESFAKRVSLPIRIMSFILYPVASLLYNFTHLLTGWISWKKEELFASEEELRVLADLAAERGTLKSEEREMIQSVFDFGETAVREIMVPRIDITGIEKSTPIDRAIEIIRASRFSKFPVYDKNIDNVEGILYAKDVLPYLNGKHNGETILSISREPYFVPESKQIHDLLKDFQRHRENIAIVVDEYGGTAGLVTVEDIVEEVVGEIRDEFDRESPLILAIDSGKWLVDAKIAINDLEDEIPIPFPQDREYDTLGGFLFEQFGDIPSVGSSIEFSDYSFEVRTFAKNRIVKVLVARQNQD